MYKTFRIPKEAGTYADTLEAYGVAHLLMTIFESQAMSNEVTINDKGVYFEIISKKAITSEIIDNLQYFQVVKFIQKDENNKPPEHLGQEFYNYPLQRDLRREKRKEIEKAVKDFKGEDYSKQRKLIEEKYQSEKVAQPLVDEYDVFAQLISNPYAAFLKLHGNFDNNQAHFKILISEVLNQYLLKDSQISTEYTALLKAKEINVDEKATMLQLINPNQGKGLNKAKATGMSVGNLKGNWIKETMKVSGALNFGMICQAVKVGSSYDMKVFVPLFSETKLNDKMAIMKDFKRTAKSNTPIKLDIVNTLKIIELLLKKSEKKERRKVKEHLLGLHSVYQKDLGQNKAVVNIGFLETPDFIDLEDKEDWLEIIEEQKKLMNGITEQGDAMIGLLAYRKFLNGSDINEYFKFHYWYAPYLMHELNKKQTYVRENNIQILNKIFLYMEKSNSSLNLKGIIENKGFQQITDAIRKSTVELQRQRADSSKPKPIYEIKYGLPQKIKNSSTSKEKLLTFLNTFLMDYFYENALVRERHRNSTHQELVAKKIYFRDLKDENVIYTDILDDFMEIFDNPNHSASLIGGLIAAYGFARKNYNSEQ